MRYLFILISCISFFSCESNSRNESSKKFFKEQSHFNIDSLDNNIIILSINNPFVGSNRIEKYCLYPKKQTKPEIENITHFIPTPIEQVVITSTTHLGFLESIGQLNSIVGVTNSKLFYSKDFLQRTRSGSIKAIGNSEINEEKLIELNPDLVFSYAIDVKGMKNVKYLRSLGQKVILVSEFMEQDPLSKTSWIYFLASFFNQNTMEKADSIYIEIEKNYREIEHLAQSSKDKPKVMMGYPWKGNWYVSGGESFQASYFKSANSEYTWKHLKQEGSIPLSTETVINDAIDADFWINCGNVLDLASVSSNGDNFDSFRAFEQNRVYNNYKKSNEYGANDYWESGVVRSDLILADLVKIMHPELMEEHELVYYFKLK